MAQRRHEALEGRVYLSAQFSPIQNSAILATSDATMTPVDQALAAFNAVSANSAPATFGPAAEDVTAEFVAMDQANTPFGIAQGMFPGRVSWAHDSGAVNQSWSLTDPSTGYWWEARNNDQAVINELMGKAVRWLTSRSTDEAAWDALFRSFNVQRGYGNVGYQAGEKIAIKVNLNNTWDYFQNAWNVTAQYSMGNNNWSDTSPQAMLALLNQLVNKAGVPQSSIYLIEPGRYFVDRLYNVLHAAFPNVHYVDRLGANGREQVVRSADPVIKFSQTVGGVSEAYLPQQYLDAKYMINLAPLKKHEMAGMTALGKNHYGSIWTPDNTSGIQWSPASVHNTLPSQNPPTEPYYSQLVDINGSPQIGGKTLLYLIDALWGGWHSNRTGSEPQKYLSAPFYGQYPASFFASQDFVAAESVALDFLAAEDALHNPPLGSSGAYIQPTADNYLHEAALAGGVTPPAGVSFSGTLYKPDGTNLLSSVGVHEHWNNPASKQYSRNLGTGQGIELVSSMPSVAPSDIWLSNNTVPENEPANTVVGTLDASDPDWSGPFSFSLVGGEGATDNGLFWIDGTTLRTTVPLDFEAGSTRSIRVRVLDQGLGSGQSPQQVATGYGFTEGPVVDSQGRVYFTAKATNRILRYDPATGLVETITSSSNGANGLDIDSQGRLLACEENLRRVTRTSGGTVTVLASTYGGQPLNSPNDVVAAANGGVYFTDPNWGTHPQPYEAVYYVNPAGTLYRVITDLVRPNGIAISKDGLTLYVADDTGRAIYAYDIQANGLLANKRLFASIPAGGNHGPDGLAVDGNGLLYAAVDHAVKVWDQGGVLRETLTMTEDPTNLAFSPDGRTLYITTQQGSLYQLNVGGYEEVIVINVGNRVEGVATVTGVSQDTGVLGDRITADRTLMIQGTSDPNLPVSVYRGGVLRGTATANGAGVWVFDDTAASLADGQYSYTAQGTDGYGGTTAMSAAYAVRVDGTAPAVSGRTINGGAAQRSMVRTIELNFSEAVDLAPGAVVLQLHSGGAVANVTLSVANPSGDKAHYTVSFSGSAVVGSSLPDGIYDLIVQAAGVTDAAGNVLTSNSTLVFHRLFGDSDGNKIVNALDYARLKNTFARASSDPLFNSAFDYEGNNLINALDLARFRQRYGLVYSY